MTKYKIHKITVIVGRQSHVYSWTHLIWPLYHFFKYLSCGCCIAIIRLLASSHYKAFCTFKNQVCFPTGNVMVCIHVRLGLNSYYPKFLLSHKIMHYSKVRTDLWQHVCSANNILQCWAGRDAQTNKSTVCFKSSIGLSTVFNSASFKSV